MTILIRRPLQDDLRPLSALLWQQGLAHRIVEEGGEQVLLLASDVPPDAARAVLARWMSGAIAEAPRAAASRPKGPPQATGSGVVAQLMQAPCTTLLIVGGVLGFFLVYFQVLTWVSALSYEPFSYQDGKLVFTTSTQPWRLVTPVFLHFGWMHIVFNALWCWELGRRIEGALGSLNLFVLFLSIAALSNFAQHVVSGSVLFGGLSGVVYGFLGFAWVAGRINARWSHLVPANRVMGVMIGWLLICVFGVIDVLGFSVANAAHVGGLLVGALIGAVFGIAHRGRA